MAMMASFIDLHGIQSLCLHCHIITKNTFVTVSTRYTEEKAVVNTIYQCIYFETSISSAKMISLGFQESRYLLLKRQNDNAHVDKFKEIEQK